jgi:hypothetical protein
MFTRDDARWLADTVGALYAARDSRSLAATGIEAVYRRFNLVASCFEEISYDHSHYLLHGARGENPLPADHAAYIHDHPALNLVQPDAKLATFQVRNLVTFRTWQATDNFNGIARRMGYNDQIRRFYASLTQDRRPSPPLAADGSRIDRVQPPQKLAPVSARWGQFLDSVANSRNGDDPSTDDQARRRRRKSTTPRLISPARAA